MVGAVLVALAPAVGQAQDFDQGKTPAQIFHSDCAICHNSTAPLTKSMGEGALASFLAVHYTENREVAAMLAHYLATQRVPDEPRRAKRSGRHRPDAGASAAKDRKDRKER
jgi:mono/diheme cytochrome c family protein